MSFILHVDFPYQGPWGAQMQHAMQSLAESINQEPGFIWKIWTENQHQLEAGGIYLFETEQTAQQYLDKHAARLKEFGVPVVNAKIFAVHQGLSLQNKAPF